MKKNEIELRSEKSIRFIKQKPSFLIRWGTLLVTIMLILLFVILHFAGLFDLASFLQSIQK